MIKKKYFPFNIGDVIEPVPFAQEDTIVQRIVLIGDAGQLTNGKHPVVDAVRQYIPLDKNNHPLPGR